jgi:WD40 repeat protein
MNRLFRVFFSSTFTDFVEERNALHKTVFPKLKQLCEVHGARFQPIDLRWGIPNEAALQQSSLQICLDEIKRCQQVTPKPNYIVFLGDRYGWCPPPAKITKEEFETISKYMSETEKICINSWYRHNENDLCPLEDGSVTTSYELQPRGEIYSNYQEWALVEKQLHKILLHSAQKAALPKSLLLNYYASATHQEIVHGALQVTGSETHVHGFIRKITKLSEDIPLNTYYEEDLERQQILEEVKEELRARLGANIYEYAVNFADHVEKRQYLENFCTDVYSSLANGILTEMARLKEEETRSPIEEEKQAHIDFGRQRSEIFVGRHEIIQEITDYVVSEEIKPFILLGEPGSGKSALFAKCFNELANLDFEDRFLFLRFIGTTSASSNSIAVLRSICEQIISECGIEWKENLPYEYKNLRSVFMEILKFVPPNKKVILLIDALDQLPKTDHARDLEWLPENLPNNVKIVISVASDDVGLFNAIKRRFLSSIRTLTRLSVKDGSEILELLLKNALRDLTINQKEYVLDKFSYNGTPLYLKLLFEQVKHWNSYDKYENEELATDIEGIIQSLLQQLYKSHTQQTVDNIFGYLVAARNGLTEDEILEVLSADCDKNFFQWYASQIYFELPEPKLPWIVWARLYADIESFLTVRGIDNTSTLVFFHRQFNDFINKHIILGSTTEFHPNLARYFHFQENFFGINRTIPNYRKASETNFQLREAGMWMELNRNLTNLEFIDMKCRSSMVTELIDDFNYYIENVTEDPVIENVRAFHKFVLNQAHIIGQNTLNLPQLIGQQAKNRPDNSFISELGRSYLESFDPPLAWFDWKNKPQESDACIRTYTGHLDVINCSAISPDGRTLLSGSKDKTLKLWNYETGDEIRTFMGHDADIKCCAFSPNGKTILSGSDDATLKLWDVATGVLIRTFIGHRGGVNCCAVSPDGKTILSGACDRLLRLWNIDTGKIIHDFLGHNSWVMACAFSPQGEKISSGDYNHVLKLWDSQTKQELRTITGHSYAIETISFSPDCSTLLTGSDDSTLKLWNINTGDEIRTFKGHTFTIWSCTFSPDGESILSASGDNTLKLWNMETGEEIRTFAGHANMVMSCAFTPDGSTILSGSWDHTLKLWDVNTGNEDFALNKHARAINWCVFSPDSSRILSVSDDRTVKLWNTQTGKVIRTFTGTTDLILTGSFSQDGKTIFVVSRNNSLRLWNIETGEKNDPFRRKQDRTTTCAISADNRLILSGFRDNILRLWEVETGKDIRTFSGHTAWPQSCTFSFDGKLVLTGSMDKTMKLWDVETGEEIQTFRGHTSSVLACAFSPDGKTVLSGSLDKTLKLWDIETGKEIRTFVGHYSSVLSCNYSPDGNNILSGSVDTTVKLWNTRTGRLIAEIPTLAWVKCISTDKNGQLAVGDSIGFLYILKPM